MGMFIFLEHGNNSALLSILKDQTWKACTLITAQQQKKRNPKAIKVGYAKIGMKFFYHKKINKSPTLIQILLIADTYN